MRAVDDVEVEVDALSISGNSFVVIPLVSIETEDMFKPLL